MGAQFIRNGRGSREAGGGKRGGGCHLNKTMKCAYRLRTSHESYSGLLPSAFSNRVLSFSWFFPLVFNNKLWIFVIFTVKVTLSIYVI